MKKVLITGATGFLGSHLVKRNLEEGNKVRIFALPDDLRAKEYERKGIEVFYGDIRDYSRVDKAAQNMQIVFHLAAVVTDWAPKRLFREVNVGGMRNICEASLKHKAERLVEVSTNDVFGLNEGLVMDETFELSPWGEPYADSKLEADKIAWEYYGKGLPVSMVYPCWVYGPGDPTFVPELVKALKNKQLLFWRKEVLVWPAYIDNVIDLLMVISTHPNAAGQGFLVHDGVSDTFQNFSAKIAEFIGAEKPKIHVPYWSAYSLAWIMELVWKILRKESRPLLTTYTVKNLGSRLQFSIEKANRLLGWQPKVGYPEGLERTFEWLKQINFNFKK